MLNKARITIDRHLMFSLDCISQIFNIYFIEELHLMRFQTYLINFSYKIDKKLIYLYINVIK